MHKAEVLADELRRLVRFRFLTVDRHSIKLWMRRPRYDRKAAAWIGDSGCGFLDLGAAGLSGVEDYDAEIVEVLR